jgi:predicted O-methyltransferase YrrM
LSKIFPKPFWLQEDEVKFISRIAGRARNVIVEIGSAFGGSSTVFLLNKNQDTKLYSIDPFVKDSKGGFEADKKSCNFAVEAALKSKNKSQAIHDWKLIDDYSFNVVKNWHKKIDILFIDGSHFYNDVRSDFEQWARFVNKDGIILFHDSQKDNFQTDKKDKIFSRGWAGPTKLVKDLEDSNDIEIVDKCYSITEVRIKN